MAQCVANSVGCYMCDGQGSLIETDEEEEEKSMKNSEFGCGSS